MPPYPTALRYWILSLLILHLAACSSLQSVAVSDVRVGPESSPVRIGDRVEVLTRDNEKLNFAVTDITADGLAGRFGFVRFDDIRRLRVRRPGGNGNTTTWILGIASVAALVALLVAADSVTVCSGGPCPPREPSE